MKDIKIIHNPYLVETKITIDGQLPKENSELNFGRRIQEWIDKLPEILIKELRNTNLNIHFTGIQNDYEDVKIAFENYAKNNSIAYRLEFEKKNDIEEVEEIIDDVFQKIQDGPVQDLKDEAIINAFNKAKNSTFEVNVIATMSSGKSTLINALLGKELMPAANEATTATIVKVIDNDSDTFSAIAYNHSKEVIEEIIDVTVDDIKILNSNKEVSIIEIKGNIPFVSATGIQLVLVDTPGPNNARDQNHQDRTYRMIANSDNSLILFVMNAQQLGIGDEKILLDYICENMQKGGKQSRERFLFAINKMDAFSPRKEGGDCIERALNGAKKGLEDRKIIAPNLFPVSAGAALEKRIEEDEEEASTLNAFRIKTQKYEVCHLEKYIHFSNLPKIAHQRVVELTEKAEGDDLVEIHTGVVSIEQAIAQYINKYARVTKVSELISSFNHKLNELSTIANIENAIREDKNEQKTIRKSIAKIEAELQDGNKAKQLSEKIDNINLIQKVRQRVSCYIDNIRKDISKLNQSKNQKIGEEDATLYIDNFNKESQAISSKINIEIEKIIKEVYQANIKEIIEDYQKQLNTLKISNTAGNFNLSDLISNSISATISVNIGDINKYKVKEKREAEVWKPWTWVNIILPDKTYVDVNSIFINFSSEIELQLNNISKQVDLHIEEAERKLKTYLQQTIKKLDNLLNEKLKELSQEKNKDQYTAEELAQKESNLKWLKDITEQMNNITKF